MVSSCLSCSKLPLHGNNYIKVGGLLHLQLLLLTLDMQRWGTAAQLQPFHMASGSSPGVSVLQMWLSWWVSPHPSVSLPDVLEQLCSAHPSTERAFQVLGQPPCCHLIPTGRYQGVERKWVSEAGLSTSSSVQQQKKSDFFIASICWLYFLAPLVTVFPALPVVAGSPVSCKLGGLQTSKNQGNQTWDQTHYFVSCS